MEAIPIFRSNAGSDRVIGVLWWDGFAKCNGDKKASCGAFGVNGRVNGTGLNPIFAERSDVLQLSMSIG